MNPWIAAILFVTMTVVATVLLVMGTVAGLLHLRRLWES